MEWMVWKWKNESQLLESPSLPKINWPGEIYFIQPLPSPHPASLGLLLLFGHNPPFFIPSTHFLPSIHLSFCGLSSPPTSPNNSPFAFFCHRRHSLGSTDSHFHHPLPSSPPIPICLFPKCRNNATSQNRRRPPKHCQFQHSTTDGFARRHKWKIGWNL